MSKSTPDTVAVPTDSEGGLGKSQQELLEATSEAISATLSLEREISAQQDAVGELRRGFEGRQNATSASLATTAKLISGLKTPSVLWGEIVRDIAQLGDGGGRDDLGRALEESAAICESFIGQGGNEELVKRIDKVVEMLGDSSDT